MTFWIALAVWFFLASALALWVVDHRPPFVPGRALIALERVDRRKS